MNEIFEINSWLRKICGTTKADYSHWINASNTRPDQSNSFCKACCQKHVDQFNQIDPGGKYFVDGGWPQDSDTPERCEECGMVLDTDFTEFAVVQEMEFWKYRRLKRDLSGPDASFFAFRLIQMLDGLNSMGRGGYLKNKLVKRLVVVKGKSDPLGCALSLSGGKCP